MSVQLPTKILAMACQAGGEVIDEILMDEDKVSKILLDIIQQTEEHSKIKDEKCWICNYQGDISYLELHHVGGRKHYHLTITVCKSCHRELSELQLVWDFRWRVKNQPEEIVKGFVFLGLHDISLLKAKRTGLDIFARYAKKFQQVAGSYLNYEERCKFQFISGPILKD